MKMPKPCSRERSAFAHERTQEDRNASSASVWLPAPVLFARLGVLEAARPISPTSGVQTRDLLSFCRTMPSAWLHGGHGLRMTAEEEPCLARPLKCTRQGSGEARARPFCLVGSIHSGCREGDLAKASFQSPCNDLSRRAIWPRRSLLGDRSSCFLWLVLASSRGQARYRGRSRKRAVMSQFL